MGMQQIAEQLTQLVAEPHWAIANKCDEIYQMKNRGVRHTIQEACVFCYKEGYITLEQLTKLNDHYKWQLFRQ